MRRVRCPTCRRETPWAGNPHRPFCSDRCRVLDLGAWVDERHRIPGDPVPEGDDLGHGPKVPPAAPSRRGGS